MHSSRTLRSRVVMCDQSDETKQTKRSVLQDFSNMNKELTKNKKDVNPKLKFQKSKQVLTLRNLKENSNTVESRSNKIKEKSKTSKCMKTEEKNSSGKNKENNFGVQKKQLNLKVQTKLIPNHKENLTSIKKVLRKNTETDLRQEYVETNKYHEDALNEGLKKHCPIYKRNNVLSSSLQQVENKTCKRDIYDITEDEDIVMEKVKKGKILVQRNASKKKKITSKKPLHKKNVKIMHPRYSPNLAINNENIDPVVHNECDGPIINDNTNQIVDNENCENIPESIKNNLKSTDIIPCTSIENIPNKALEQLNPEFLITDANYEKKDGKEILLEFLEDFEKSFTFPNMTSTPDNSNHNSKNINPVFRKSIMAEISSILPVKPRSNDVVKTPLEISLQQPLKNNQLTLKKNIVSEIPHVKHYSNEIIIAASDSPPQQPEIEEVVLNDDNEITLFESPSKPKSISLVETDVPKASSPVATMQINLFNENFSVSPVKVNSEGIVLKSKKGYHTPEQFRRHLSKSSKTVFMDKKKKKTKEDILCEELNKQFEEIGSFELCIE